MYMYNNMRRVMRKPEFCLCENKDADQLRSNCEADQRLCFLYMDSTIPFLLVPKISSFYPSSVSVQVSLCQTWSETLKTGFLASRLNYAAWQLGIPGKPNNSNEAATRENRSSGFPTRSDTN